MSHGKASCRALALLLLAIAPVFLPGCDSDEDEAGPDVPDHSADAAAVEVEKWVPQIIAFCGSCHAMPQPETFPRDAWHHEIETAYDFFYDSNRKETKPPPMTVVVRWYRQHAPERLTLQSDDSTPSPVSFRRAPLSLNGLQAGPASVSDIHVLAEPGAGASAFLFSDMQHGHIGEVTPSSEAEQKLRLLAQVGNPAHMEPSDLDSDGRTDFLISDLGSYQPGDHRNGRLVWFHHAESGEAVTHVLLNDVGRIADARSADFDGDGDQDIIVAEFGWIKTGGIHFLEQTGSSDGIPTFTRRLIDDRHGTINVPIADLDADGDLDFVAVISQEHEEIAAFLNRGDGVFERQIILAGSDPGFGSSGIELVDLDGDHDLDVLYVNGDTLDSDLPKPYHAVQWMENTGDFPFDRRVLTHLPGATRAIAADVDADGDQDIVATAWIPSKNRVSSPHADGQFDILVWLEQTRPGKFERHSLARARTLGYMAAAITDLDGNGTADIVAGHFGDNSAAVGSGIEVFWNGTPRH